MLVSCLTVTQAGRLHHLRHAVGDFTRQSWPGRELVIVHDGGPELAAAIAPLAAAAESAPVRVVAAPPGTSLGLLRNLAAEAARGEIVCQWDDDDRYHPRRLELQVGALRDRDADFCFLADQLHWYPATGELTWDDWDREPYPLNFVQGTLLGRRDALPAYEDLPRGEDTAACLALLDAGRRIARLRDAGWCYVYTYHGANAWPLQHHRAISRAKAFGAARLVGREALLRARLAEYDPPLGRVVLAHAAGEIVID